MFGLFRSRWAAALFMAIVAMAILVGAIMIKRSSIIAIDGQRYFALFDDAMIAMRYADNLVAGRGLVWNPGERVEGFSSPLWVFVLAAAIAVLGRDLGVAGIQVFGLLLAILDLVLVASVTRRILGDRPGRDVGTLMAVLFTTTFYPVFYWSIMGMETGLVVTLILFATWLSLGPQQGARKSLVIAAVYALVCLTRPEAVLLVVVCGVFALLRRARAGTLSWRLLGLQAAVVVGPIAVYQVFRRLYFGQWYANSYLLKLGGLGLMRRLQDGWRFSRSLLAWSGWLAGAVTLVLVWNWLRPSPTEKSDFGTSHLDRLWEFLIAFLVMVAYQVVVGGDAWPILERFPAPAVVLLIIAFVVVVLQVTWRVFRNPSGGMIVLGLALLGILRFSLGLHRGDVFTLTPLYSDFAAANINAGLLVRELTREDATVSSFFAGVVPYYSQRKAIDPLGRVDPYIAALPAHQDAEWGRQGSLPGHNKYDLGYSLQTKRPTAIIVDAWGACTWGRQDLRSWCRENYHLVRVGTVQVLLEKNSPQVRWERFAPRSSPR